MRSAYVTLDLSAVSHNLARVRAVAPGARIMAVVKANAYGHGLCRIAACLPDVDGFAVARLDEGLAREAGIRQRIVVLQGFADPVELQRLAAQHLEPVVHAPYQVDLLERALLREPIGVWVKLDTGMHRLGLLPEEFGACWRRLVSCPAVRKPIPVMTHLANADAPRDSLTELQLERLEAAVGDRSERSAANSAGVLAFARPPGLDPAGHRAVRRVAFPHRHGCDEGLRPVMTFRSRLIAIKWLAAGDRVGYGGDWICPVPPASGSPPWATAMAIPAMPGPAPRSWCEASGCR